VSELVKLHHGKISIQSTPHIGTVIKVDFPARHPTQHNTEEKGPGNGHDKVTLDFSKKGDR
jgi:hypothetical protein